MRAAPLRINDFNGGECIIREEERTDAIFFIMSGAARISRDAFPPIDLKEGDGFGGI